MGDRNQSKQPGGFGGAPFAAGTIRQWNHHRLQVFAANFEFAHALELHRFTSEVLFGGDCVREYVEQKGAAAGGVHSERHCVAHHRLKQPHNIN